MRFEIGAGYRIRHTARTWGLDIQSLIANWLHGLIKTPSKFARFLDRNSFNIWDWIEKVVRLGTILIIFLVLKRYIRYIGESVDGLANAIVTSGRSISSEESIVTTFVYWKDVFVQYPIVYAILVSWLFYEGIQILVSIIDDVLMEYELSYLRGAILISDRDTIHSKKVKRSYLILWVKVIASFILSIVAGVGANAVYYHWMTP
jgi:hypothetical protein